ncbi:MAG TPA: MarR family transcriptional regulator [Dehalococcoidia bacterium]|nr:MarR family transcriptional regulator [Dehalococcoidia bacterium]
MAGAEDLTDDERIRDTVSRYAKHFPWLSNASFEAYISLLQTMRVYIVAIERYLNSVGQPKPISSARHTVLRILYFAEGYRLSQHEIAREVGISRTNITNLIDALERDGLVTRARAMNPADRRTNHVELTQEGLEFCSTFIPAVAEFMASMFQDLSEAELAQLNEVLARVREGMYRRYLRVPLVGVAGTGISEAD